MSPFTDSSSVSSSLPQAPLSAPSSPKSCQDGQDTASISTENPPSSEPFKEVKVAVGQANGRISLFNFQNGGSLLKEFGPKTGRSCNDLAWNPVKTNYLAAAYDKNRSDHSILIFDTNLTPAEKSSSSSSRKPANNYIGPSVEIGLGEACHSLAWFHSNPDTLVAGMNLKNLKIFDLRLSDASGSPRPVKTNVSRLCLGLCVDPHMDHRVASFYEDTVVIWDTRNFDKPIWTGGQKAEVVHLAWSPTRSGLLCSLVKESTDTLTLHDIQSWAVMSEDGEPAVTQRVVNVSPLEYPGKCQS